MNSCRASGRSRATSHALVEEMRNERDAMVGASASLDRVREPVCIALCQRLRIGKSVGEQLAFKQQ